MALSPSTPAEWVSACGAQLQPLVDALKDEMLRHSVLHADETPVAILVSGKKKTHRAYLWVYCPGVFDDLKAVVYDFAPSLKRWAALTRYIDDGQLPIDNNWVDNRIRPIMLGPAICRLTACGSTRCRCYELDLVGQAQQARPACVSEGYAATPASAFGAADVASWR